LKFHRRLEAAPLLGALLAGAVMRSGEPLPELIVPVPMSHARLRQRGYNQALELARPVSRQLGIPLDWQSCRRARHTPAQTSLKARERRKNMRGAFVVQRGLPSHVAILDDVITTGATATELALALKRSGVARVEVWACARAGEGGESRHQA
jgi:ComF family protein